MQICVKTVTVKSLYVVGILQHAEKEQSMISILVPLSLVKLSYFFQRLHSDLSENNFYSKSNGPSLKTHTFLKQTENKRI